MTTKRRVFHKFHKVCSLICISNHKKIIKLSGACKTQVERLNQFKFFFEHVRLSGFPLFVCFSLAGISPIFLTFSVFIFVLLISFFRDFAV